MKTVLINIFPLLALISFGQNSEFEKFIPVGYSIMSLHAGDLNLDGISDEILVLRKNGEDSSSTAETPVKRKLFVLLGQTDMSFKLEAQNDNIIYFYGYDPNFRDAFVNLTIKPGQFSVDHYGGFAERWGRTTTFKYNKYYKTWYLYCDEFSTFDVRDLEKEGKEKVLTSKNFGKVPFNKFNIYKKWE